jgi:RimJ/RimL family protein N-acetyltransferase
MKAAIETERLVLREMTLRDLDFVAAMLAHPEVMRFWPQVYSREEAETWVRRQRERYVRDGHGYWLVLDRAAGEPVGQAGILQVEIEGQKEAGLGYLVHRPFWRRGFGSEAAAASLDWAFDHLDPPRVVSLIRPENVPSIGVARKLGMEEAGRTMYAGFEHLVYAIARP